MKEAKMTDDARNTIESKDEQKDEEQLNLYKAICMMKKELEVLGENPLTFTPGKFDTLVAIVDGLIFNVGLIEAKMREMKS